MGQSASKRLSAFRWVGMNAEPLGGEGDVLRYTLRKMQRERPRRFMEMWQKLEAEEEVRKGREERRKRKVDKEMVERAVKEQEEKQESDRKGLLGSLVGGLAVDLEDERWG